MDLLLQKGADVSALSPLALAFVGDTVFDLLTRTSLVLQANRPVNDLHKSASKKVCAAAQSESIKKIMPLLTEDELAVFKRGRNARTSSIPKNASSADYHYATGLESLFGWLYLKGETSRIFQLYDEINNEK